MIDQLQSALLPHYSQHRLDALAIVAIKTTIVYIFLVVGLRLMGKRELGQMNIYDLVLIIVLANAVQNAMVGDDNTLAGGLVAATTLLILNRLFNLAMQRSERLVRVMVGGPLLIAHDGELLPNAMKREGVTRDQVMSALRAHGLDDISQIKACVLEVDGTMSIIPKDSASFRTRRHFRALRLQ